MNRKIFVKCATAAEIQKESQKNLEECIRSRMIFFDTSSLMSDFFGEWMDHAEPILAQNNARLYILEPVVEELQYLAKSYDLQKAQRAQNAIRLLNHLHRHGLVVYLMGYGSGETADVVFVSLLPMFCKKNDILVITQDRDLSGDIQKVNKNKSCTGKFILVKRINQYGFFSCIQPREQESSQSQQFAPTVPENEKFALCTGTVVPDSTPIGTLDIPGEGDTILADGQQIHLMKEISSGGEGTVYETDTNFVAKIYKADKLTKAKYDKLRLMMDKNLYCPGICFPTAFVSNDRNEFVGYLMPKAQGKELKTLIGGGAFSLSRYFPDWKKEDTVLLTNTILEKIQFLHHRNIIMGDINLSNFLVVSPTEVYLVDTDSFQIENYPCPVGTDQFTPPELQGIHYGSLLRTMGSENFALAVLLFMIMLPGKHPYAHQGGGTTVENIREMNFPYPLGEDSSQNSPLGDWRFIWSHLTYRLKEAFYHTFIKDGRFSAEEDRPGVDQWLHIFREYYKLLHNGTLGNRDPESELLFPARCKHIRTPYSGSSSRAC